MIYFVELSRFKILFLEAQLLYDFIDVTDSLRHSLTGRVISSTSPLFVDRFGRSLQFCYLEFDKEAISDIVTNQAKHEKHHNLYNLPE